MKYLLKYRNSLHFRIDHNLTHTYTHFCLQCLFVGVLFSTLFLRTTMDTNSLAGGSLYLAIIFYSITHSMFNGYVEMGIIVSGSCTWCITCQPGAPGCNVSV